jgi:cell division protein FtsL
LTRINAILAIAVVVCSIGLVTSQHRARTMFVELERVQRQARQLDVQWEQLQLEQSGLAKPSRIDTKARSGLAMQSVPADRTLHLNADLSVELTALKGAR